MKTTLYSTPTCPKCKQVKKALEDAGKDFQEMDMSSPAGLTELRVEGVFTTSAPVLFIGGVFYLESDLFEEDKLINMEEISWETRKN